ncbi:acyl carrier protein [Roseivivax sp. CAU 1753]
MKDDATEALQSAVITVLQETTQDWDLEIEEEIGPETTLIEELQFESIDVVQFCVALEQKLGTKGLPFEKLFIQDGAYVDDVTVGDVVNFLQAEHKPA